MFRAENRCKEARLGGRQTNRRTDQYKGKPSGPAVSPLQPLEGFRTLPVPVAAGVWPGPRDGTEWMMRWREEEEGEIGGPQPGAALEGE